MTLEYTIEIGFDNHVSAGYASFVASTPEEAVELRAEKRIRKLRQTYGAEAL